MTGVFMRRPGEDIQVEHHVTMKARLEGCSWKPSNAQYFWKPPETGKKQERIPLYFLQRKHGPVTP